MSDEVVNDSANISADSSPNPDRSRKPRKRGRRNRSRSAEGQSPAQGVTETQAPAESTRPQPPQQRERGPRRSGQRPGTHGYGDGLDRFVCTSVHQGLPEEWPVNHRRGLAVAPLQEVDRRGRECLLCDRLHAGPCLWPDGVEVGTVEPVHSESVAEPVRPAERPESPDAAV